MKSVYITVDGDKIRNKLNPERHMDRGFRLLCFPLFLLMIACF